MCTCRIRSSFITSCYVVTAVLFSYVVGVGHISHILILHARTQVPAPPPVLATSTRRIEGMRLLRKTHPYRSPIWNHITHTFTTCPLIPGVSKKALAKLSRLESTYESTMERMKDVREDNSLLREAQNTPTFCE